ncbi:MAG: sigma-70 family RNA polymerase sigma factor, partial [Planctomycetaceae bacterium]
MTHDEGAAGDALLDAAVAGDPLALEKLLWLVYDRLELFLQGDIPRDLQSVIGTEDVIQEAFLDVCCGITRFELRGEGSFYNWCATIARHRLLDRIKAHRALKRGGPRRDVGQANATADSMTGLIEQVACAELSPSGVADQIEARRVVTVALSALKDDYRIALTRRYIEGLPVADIAREMERTERAVHMLCNRGLKKLRETLGRSSYYF